MSFQAGLTGLILILVLYLCVYSLVDRCMRCIEHCAEEKYGLNNRADAYFTTTNYTTNGDKTHE